MGRKFMLLTLFAALLATSAFVAPAPRAQDATPRRIEITAKRFSFDPGEITLKKGEPVVLVLTSADVAHGLRIHEFNIDVTLKTGGTQEVQFTPDKTGDFIGHCAVFCGPGHGSMTFKLHVVE